MDVQGRKGVILKKQKIKIQSDLIQIRRRRINNLNRKYIIYIILTLLLFILTKLYIGTNHFNVKIYYSYCKKKSNISTCKKMLTAINIKLKVQ